MIYVIKVLRFTQRNHLNQLRTRITNEADSGPPVEKVMDVKYDTFDIPTLLPAPEMRRCKRKRKATDFIVVSLKCIRSSDQKQIKLSQSLTTLNLV